MSNTKAMSIVRKGGTWRAVHPGCWSGSMHPARTIEGRSLAERDAADHERAHASGAGWFDFVKGWVSA